MKTRKFGKTGLQVSALGFGGAEIGFEDAPQTDVDALLGSALDAGLNVIDTAACYADSEEKIGQGVSHRRSEYHLFTKCGHASGLPQEDWSPDLIEASIDRSLQRLQTDHVDLVLLHSCGRDVLAKGDAIAAVQKARDTGKARFIGYSGDNEPLEYAISLGVFDAIETSLNVADQSVIERALPAAVEAKLGIIIKRPIANAAWRWEEESAVPDYPKTYWKRLQQLRYPELEHAPDVAAGVAWALRFTLTTPGVSTAIVGTKNPRRWAENAAFVDEGALQFDDYESTRRRWRQVSEADWIGQG